jgi:hypothetical protein
LAQAVEMIVHNVNLALFLADMVLLLKPGGPALLTSPILHSAQDKLLFTRCHRLKQFYAKEKLHPHIAHCAVPLH